MTQLQKSSLLGLDWDSYEIVRRWVLERDGWRCQFCGSTSGVEVHHIEHRSQGGSDREENLITLCCQCHMLTHSRLRRESHIVEIG